MYSSALSMEAEIEFVKNNAPGGAIDDLSWFALYCQGLRGP